MKLLNLCCFLLYVTTAIAQDKDITGRYRISRSHSPEGNPQLFILPGHQYAVPYFGGVQTGTWSISGNKVTFKPNVIPYDYMIWGRKNSRLKDSTRFMFMGFDEDENFLSFDDAVARPVLNADNNCVPYPLMYKFLSGASTINLQCKGRESGLSELYQFANAEHYNDFVIIHFQHHSEERPFYALIKEDGLHFDEEGAAESGPLPDDGETKAFLEEVLTAANKGLADTLLFNPFYNQCFEGSPDAEMFSWNENKQAFIDKYNYQPGEEEKKEEESYNRCFILFPFKKLNQLSRSTGKLQHSDHPLIVATCKEQ